MTTIFWCEEHVCSGTDPNWCIASAYRKGAHPVFCRMVERRLWPVDALPRVINALSVIVSELEESVAEEPA